MRKVTQLANFGAFCLEAEFLNICSLLPSYRVASALRRSLIFLISSSTPWLMLVFTLHKKTPYNSRFKPNVSIRRGYFVFLTKYLLQYFRFCFPEHSDSVSICGRRGCHVLVYTLCAPSVIEISPHFRINVEQ